MKENFWYFDNWYGNRKGFSTLRTAISTAKKETHGASITIFWKKGVKKIIDINGLMAI